MKKRGNESKTIRIIKAVVTVLLMFALFFIPAGTFDWPEAWLFLFLYFTMAIGTLVWMRKNAPGLLKERMSRRKERKSWDKIIMTIYPFLLIALLVITGFDAVRFHWSKVSWVAKAFGFIGFFFAASFAFWAVRTNAFASDVVRIQDDRGHRVCTTGPYRFVRHPMYVGVILLLLSFPLALGSLYAFIPVLFILILFILRTSLEDKALHQELPGYKEYAKKVRYRLFPGVW